MQARALGRRTGWDCLAAAVLLALGSCQSADRVTAPRATDAPCAGGASLQLAPLGVAGLDCVAGTTVTLAGDGASYLVAATLAAGDVSPEPVAYTISVPAPAVYASVPLSASLVAAASSAPAANARTRSPGTLARAFDAALRSRGAILAGSGERAVAVPIAPDVRARNLSPAVAASNPPAVGSSRAFQVLASTDFAHESYRPVTARLAYAGAGLLLYVDEASPAGGFTDTELGRLGEYYDRVLYPLDEATFGPPSDIDGNGRLIMLLSPVVNALVSADRCATAGYIGGFFNPVDLSSGGSTSNRGEVFYAIVPDPAGTRSCPHGVSDVEALLGGTFLHEVQHLISYSQHVLVHRGKADAGWLDEGLSLVAEELGSLYYAAKYPAPLGRASATQPLPDSALPFLANAIDAAHAYLGAIETASLTTHSDADAGQAWRGGDWLFLRWLGDHEGGADFYRAIDQTALTGVADIEAAAGEPLPSLFGDFALALYADSLPDIPRSAVPARNRFTTWTLRRIVTGADGADYPLEPMPLTGSSTRTLVAGGVALYRINTKRGSGTLTLRFSTPGGAPLPSALRPRLSIMRLL